MSLKRPCNVPKIQIDTWQARHTSATQVDPACLAKEICTSSAHLVVKLLLRNARTLRDYASVVQCLNEPLVVTISSGQLYLHRNWRIRYNDMSKTMQDMVVSIGSAGCKQSLQEAFSNHYSAKKMENELYKIIGRSREEGTRCLLQYLHLL